MTLSPPDFPVYSLPHELGSCFIVTEDGIYALKRTRGETCWHRLVIYPDPAHLFMISPIDRAEDS